MTASPYFFVFTSSMTVSRMKFEGRGSEGECAAASLDLDEDKFVVLILLYSIWVSGFAAAGRFPVAGYGFPFSWQIACNAVVSFQGSASARSFASGACSMRLRNAARILPSSESRPRHGCGS